MDVSQAGSFQLGQAELEGVGGGEGRCVGKTFKTRRTNTLTFSLIRLTDGNILPQQGDDLGREAQKTINT